MKYIVTESQNKKTLKSLLGEYGVRTLCKMTGKKVKDIIDEAGIKGTKEDIIFLTKTIIENDLSSVLKYCNYRIIPTQYSMDLVVFIPKPSPENVGKYMFDEGNRNIYRDTISNALHKLGGGLIRGHNVEVHNTGNC